MLVSQARRTNKLIVAFTRFVEEDVKQRCLQAVLGRVLVKCPRGTTSSSASSSTCCTRLMTARKGWAESRERRRTRGSQAVAEDEPIMLVEDGGDILRAPNLADSFGSFL